jgi:hypothetical protein
MKSLLFLFLLIPFWTWAAPLEPAERLWYFVWSMEHMNGEPIVRPGDWKAGDNLIAFQFDRLEEKITNAEARDDWKMVLRFLVENRSELDAIRDHAEKALKKFSAQGLETSIRYSTESRPGVEVSLRTQRSMTPETFAKAALSFLSALEPVARQTLNSDICSGPLNPRPSWAGWKIPHHMRRVDPNKALF